MRKSSHFSCHGIIVCSYDLRLLANFENKKIILHQGVKLTTLIFTVGEIDPQSSERKEAGKETDLCVAQNIVKKKNNEKTYYILQ